MRCKPVCEKKGREKVVRGVNEDERNETAALRVVLVSGCGWVGGGGGVPGVREGTLRAVLLDVHAEEAHVHPVDLLKRKKCFGSVWEGLHHLTRVHEPEAHQNTHNLVIHTAGRTTFHHANNNNPSAVDCQTEEVSF